MYYNIYYYTEIPQIRRGIVESFIKIATVVMSCIVVAILRSTKQRVVGPLASASAYLNTIEG